MALSCVLLPYVPLSYPLSLLELVFIWLNLLVIVGICWDFIDFVDVCWEVLELYGIRVVVFGCV